MEKALDVMADWKQNLKARGTGVVFKAFPVMYFLQLGSVYSSFCYLSKLCYHLGTDIQRMLLGGGEHLNHNS